MSVAPPHTVILASAGTGKTHALTSRFLSLYFTTMRVSVSSIATLLSSKITWRRSPTAVS